MALYSNHRDFYGLTVTGYYGYDGYCVHWSFSVIQSVVIVVIMLWLALVIMVIVVSTGYCG